MGEVCHGQEDEDPMPIRRHDSYGAITDSVRTACMVWLKM